MTISEDDVAAARRILAEHETKFGGIRMIQPPAVPTPADHPDHNHEEPDDPDGDMAYIHTMYQALDWFREIVGATTEYGRDVFDRMCEKYNDMKEWSPYAAMIREISIMETIGLQIQEDR